MAGSGSDDELARTATANSEPAAAPVLEATLGRYRLERKLGEGGMGVVHAAFDPDLERRVALKVLRSSGDSSDARQRLLREARAMARLTHPNVVTVHEVGSASGRDYVAMELINGDSLVDWLRATRHPPREIIAAFIAAGRGLAAAHAAGLVHRDFKPHNVLRGRDGRIVVTDFGLARGVEAIATGALEITIDVRAAATTPNTPSSLSGLTATGSVLGTPAYMAPEQWAAGTVGPAADQFAYCVALWEALVGERPYRGTTIEQLQAEVRRGPADLDASKLPRRLRAPLRRGLDADPDKRWRNMEALLAVLVRGERRPTVALVAGGGAVIAAAAIYLALRPGTVPAAPPCEPPAQDVATVWPADAAKLLAAAGREELGKAFDRDIATWRTARGEACHARNAAQLACFDGVLARTDAIHHALAKVSGEITDKTIGMLVDPAVCTSTVPPRLALQPSADTIAAFVLLIDGSRRDTTLAEAAAATFAARPGLDPCARAVALLAVDAITRDVPRGKTATTEAVTAADACGDDRLRADTLLAETPYEYESPLIGPRGRAALQKAKVAVDRVAQPDLVAEIDQERANIAAQDEHWDQAFPAAEAAVDKFGARGRTRTQLGAVAVVNSLRFKRNGAGDMEAVRAAIAKWTPAAASLHDEALVHGFEGTDAYARLFLGDLEGAHPAILGLWHSRPHAGVPTQHVDGTVVDEQGHPVAGATIATAPQLFLDSIGPLPFGDTSDLRIVTTDRAGAFTIADAPMAGPIVAQTDARHRSGPLEIAPHVRIVLAPTRRLAGKVDLGTTPHTQAFVMATRAGTTHKGTYVVMAPLRADGSFSVEGAPVGELKVGVATWSPAAASSVEFTPVPASTTDTPNLVLKAPASARTLDVIARSAVATPLDSAQVFTLTGKHELKTVGDLMSNHEVKGLQQKWANPIVGEAIPSAAIGKTKPGDLIAHFTHVPDGELTVCVIGMNGDLQDPTFAGKLAAHRNELVLQCASPGATDTAIVVEAPPQKRLD